MEWLSSMDGYSLGIVISLFVLIACSAFFSATETAFSTMNRIRLKGMAAAGSSRAQLALSIYERYDTLLSTILIGNNIVNIAAASLATVVFTRALGDAGVSVSTAVMTVLVLIFGEVSPKSLAKENPEQMAMFAAPVLHMLMRVLTPLNWLFQQWKKLLSRLFHAREPEGITEEELLTIVDEAQQEGGLDQEESDLIRSAIEFNDMDVEEILTPRVDLTAVEQEDSWREICDTFKNCGFSRLPVYREDIDHIVGVIHERDFFTAEPDTPLSQLIKPVLYVPTSAQISDLLRLLQKSKTHMAVVTDEYGGTMGIVTMEDILEELVGEIWDEHDEVIEEFEKLEDGAYRIRCSADLDKMLALFKIDREFDSATVSGWVVEEMGCIPREGDTFQYEDLEVTILKTDGRRVLEIRVVQRRPELAAARPQRA